MDFRALKIRLASPDEILTWSYGEVLKPETINYRTQKAERDGLFSEAIFGPEHDFHCYCGKYRRIRYKGIICDKCGVEVTRSIVRRERMGHIKLSSPVAHIWFLRGVPSRIALLLDASLPDLEKVIYFASYIITDVNEETKTEAMKKLENEFRSKMKEVSSEGDRNKVREIKEREKSVLKGIKKYQVISEIEYRELSMKYGEVFKAGIGAEAVKRLLEQIDIDAQIKIVQEDLYSADNILLRRKIMRKLKLLQGFKRANIRPEWMILTVLPVIPPALRPMVQLDGGRFATSDLNDLYRRVINRNNRLKHLLELKAPEVITRNEKRMLQEAVDALIDNTMRKGQTLTTASTGQKRALKSLADVLKGKQGRFRQNLLGKRVDYSGRSVIVIGPELKIDECGLPKNMALELFKPFVIHNLIQKGITHNIRSATRLIEEATPDVWEALEEAIKDKLVLLNRAPTLHRLGVQAFKPKLHEGKAIRIPALPTIAFNADFDGDQMAVHLPITAEAQWEARNLMLSSRGVLKPSTGRPIATPKNDIVLGCYYLTGEDEGVIGEGKIFSSEEEAHLAYDHGFIGLRAKIRVRVARPVEGESIGNKILETTVGRIIFNGILPEGLNFINRTLNKSNLNQIEERVLENYPGDIVIKFLNAISHLGFKYATLSGLSWALGDVTAPSEKSQVIEEADQKILENRELYEQGLLTERERRTRAIEIWTDAKSKLSADVKQSINKKGSVYMMVDSKARGSWPVVDQLMGMVGLVVNPAGSIIELPVKSSLVEGLSVLEYFISTHGARKGLADTALRTATAGYLTRRLVDVAQDVVIREEDCGDIEGMYIYTIDGKATDESLGQRIWGRVSLETIKDNDGKAIIQKGKLITREQGSVIDGLNLERIKIRSIIYCKSRDGVCKMCYGYDLGRNKLVEIGEAVGIVTAQAIGEPGTQLTMRTFHTGGVAGGGDITMGLPRVEEIFEARHPRNSAVVADASGRVIKVVDQGNQKIIKILTDDGGEEREYSLPMFTTAWVKEGDLVTAGQQLSEGHLDLKDLYQLTGGNKNEVARYITTQIKSIYFSAGEGLNDKHVELIVRQMFSRVRIIEPGDTMLLSGDITELSYVLNENDRALKEKGKPATFEQLLLGITKVSLTTESFLSSASFQETARVLIEASVSGKVDVLKGLKENVIIGRLIPAGTGYRDTR